MRVISVLMSIAFALCIASVSSTASAGDAAYRVTGKIGDMPVDLIVTPMGGAETKPAAAPKPSSAEPSKTAPVVMDNKAAALVRPSLGQMPNDTGTDNTRLSIEERPELGGKALKVVYAPGDSAGQTAVKVGNWQPFQAIQFDVFNPNADKVRLNLTVKHQRSSNYQTRVEIPLTAPPGKSTVRLDLTTITNVNGSAPDLSLVKHWYISCPERKPTTMYFGDFWLLPKGGAVPVPGAEAAAAPKAVPVSDPARLARIRGAKMPPVTKPVMFNTPEADAVCSALEVFPPDNPWNQVVENWPLHPDSAAMITSIGPQKPFRYNPDMGFIIVPPGQKMVELVKVGYAGESDKGPFPIPENVPLEGWPAYYQGKAFTLDDVQRDRMNKGGDRHAIVLDPAKRMLYEFFGMKKTDRGWEAAQASVFDLKSNKLRPDGWTSADAAGLPIFPGTVRYDEIQRGIVEHAMRVTITRTRRAYIPPATHFASRLEDKNLPRMGERLRLRKDFDISGFSPAVQAILQGLKKYGMFVADNGIDWAISVTPDPRIPDMNAELRRVKGSDFEVVIAGDYSK